MDYIIDITKYMSQGALVSLKIFVVTLIFSLPLSVLLAILYRNNRLLKRIISYFTWFFRGTPLMLQLFFIMYGLPAIGIQIDRMLVAYIGFSVNYTAYFTEILRSGIESIDKDQFESAKVMGCKNLTMYRYVILPQAFRNVSPVITNEVITLIKDTALITVIALSDIMRNVKEIVSRDFTVSPFIIAAIFYLLISFLIVRFFRYFERKNDFIESSI